MTAPFDAALIDPLTTIVSRAAATILAIRTEASLHPRAKADQSPVTAADTAAEAVILEGLSRLMPGVPVISEEASAQSAAAVGASDVVLVDPVDGTRELVAGRDEFTVNLGVLRAGRPALGIVAAPALGLIWRTAANGGAQRLRLVPGTEANAAREITAIRTRPMPASGIVAAVSRSHFDPATAALLARLGEVTTLASGSAIKFCRVAEGTADLYPRLAPTYPWDVAAGHAVLAAAGGIVTTPDRLPLTYALERGNTLEHGSGPIPGFIAWGDPSAVGRGR